MNRTKKAKELFGNDAADDEVLAKLMEFFVDLPGMESIRDTTNRLIVVQGRKGTGKSAVLRYYSSQIKQHPNSLVLNIRGPDLISKLGNMNDSPSQLITAWKRILCGELNRAIAKKLSIAFDDNDLQLVEQAELEGIKERNIVGALFDRFSFKSIGVQKIGIKNEEESLRRAMAAGEYKAWIFIDDIDATFISNGSNRLIVSTFFTAARYLTNDVLDLNVRASIRSDVWAELCRTDEALDKCSQYLYAIHWNSRETRAMIFRRVESFYANTPEDDTTDQDVSNDDASAYLTSDDIFPARMSKRKLALLASNIFPYYVTWKRDKIPLFNLLHMYAQGRPRWVIQLCKFALQASKNEKINREAIRCALPEYSRLRLNELIKEHEHQCARLRDVVNMFLGCGSQWETNALRARLGNEFNAQNSIEIEGNNPASAASIARFLFRIGFITPYNYDSESNTQIYFRFEEMPDLLYSESQSMKQEKLFKWSVHPAFHLPLHLSRDFHAKGKVISPQRQLREHLPGE